MPLPFRKYILIVGGFYIVTILTAFTIFMRKEISNPIVFFFLMAFCNLNIDGALFYFYTDSAEKYPEGPHFSVFFYTSGLGLSMMLGYLTGFITGEKLFCAWSYQAILVLTISLTAVLRLSLLPLILRSTPLVADTVWACAVTYTSAVVNAWMWLPKQAMYAGGWSTVRVCPSLLISVAGSGGQVVRSPTPPQTLAAFVKCVSYRWV